MTDIQLKPQYVPQYPTERPVMTKPAVLMKLLTELGVRSKFNGSAVVIRGQAYKHLPVSTPLNWVFKEIQTLGRVRHRKSKVGGKTHIVMTLKSPKIYFDGLYPTKDGRVRVPFFQLVAHPVVFWDERTANAKHARAYMQLWWDSKP